MLLHEGSAVCSVPYFLDDGSASSSVTRGLADRLVAESNDKLHIVSLASLGCKPHSVELANGETPLVEEALHCTMSIKTMCGDLVLPGTILEIIPGDSQELIIGQRDAVRLHLVPLKQQFAEMYGDVQEDTSVPKACAAVPVPLPEESYTSEGIAYVTAEGF